MGGKMRVLLALMFVVFWVTGCAALKFKQVGNVPPRPSPGAAKIIMRNCSERDADAFLHHKQSGRFYMESRVPPGATAYATVPQGAYHATERYWFGDDWKQRRASVSLGAGKTYEWQLGEKPKK